ncbi:hypothetical protein F4781DRAFT_408390 [Annulohypoxylon bovei var. microspora]|nr:hypothetical protein F4781DRAFT_408390 [Annulohypoxylon bovei var. microspora]
MYGIDQRKRVWFVFWSFFLQSCIGISCSCGIYYGWVGGLSRATHVMIDKELDNDGWSDDLLGARLGTFWNLMYIIFFIHLKSTYLRIFTQA